MQLDTYERVKEKVSSTSAPFSLARQRLQRANSGINGRPASDSRPEASTHQPDTATTATKSPFQNAPGAASPAPERVRVHKMLVASPAVDLTPPKQTLTGTPSSRGQPPRQSSVKAPASPPLNHPAVLSSAATSTSKPPARQGSEAVRGGSAAPPGEPAHGAPVTPERQPSGRMHSGRIPPGLAAHEGDPGHNLKPIQTARSLSRGNSLLIFSPRDVVGSSPFSVSTIPLKVEARVD